MSDVKRCKHGRNFCLECHDEKDSAAALLVECERLRKERDQLRAERDSHQRLCIAEMEKNAQLRAELEAISGKGVLYVSAESLADDGVVGMHATRKPNAVQNVALYALQPQQPDAVSVPGVLEFAVEILRGALEGGNFDGGDIQEMGVRHGLLFPEHRTERCGEHCECAEYGFPVECFRIARALLSTKNAEEGE